MLPGSWDFSSRSEKFHRDLFTDACISAGPSQEDDVVFLEVSTSENYEFPRKKLEVKYQGRKRKRKRLERTPLWGRRGVQQVFVVRLSHFGTLCFVGVVVRLVNRSDVITGQPLPEEERRREDKNDRQAGK